MARRWLIIEPYDTVAVRDGRAFDAGSQSVARAVAPHPGTVAGAVGAAFAAEPGAGAKDSERGRSVPAELHGPVTVQRLDSGRWRACYPMPRTVTRDGDTWHRLTPRGQRWPGVDTDLGGVVLLGGPKGEPAGWVTGSELGRFLADPAAMVGVVGPPWTVERRVGLARDDDRTARDGMLYAAEHLRPAVDRLVKGLGFAVGCVSPPKKPLRESVFLGGEGRRAQVHDWTDAGDNGPLPAAPDSFEAGRLMLYLATPAVFTAGWRPADTDLRGGRLAAAAVGPAQPIAMSRPDRRTGGLNARRLLWAVPAGSVYFLDFDGDTAAAGDAARHWHGRGLPYSDETLRTAGFGLALTGRW